MNIVLLSGGSGKRLWPLSNNKHSKQFLPLFKYNNGQKSSMFQLTLHNICEVDKDNNIIVATNCEQVDLINEQSKIFGEIKISAEPKTRDTFPAIALACAKLIEETGLEYDEPIVVMPVDAIADSDFYYSIRELSDSAKNYTEGLCLLGIDPTCASTKYGYIKPCDTKKLSKVEKFVEKPDEKRAGELVREKCLWNCGVFSFCAGYIRDKIKEKTGYKTYDELLKNFSKLEKISFDYAVCESEKNIQVLKFSGNWSDVGTWSTLCDFVDEQTTGFAIQSGCSNTNLMNNLDIPISAIGLENCIIAATEDGIIVATKDQADKIKEISSKLTLNSIKK